MLEGLLPLRRRLREHAPLVHCITGPVSSNDCANMVLAAGARPILAEHPDEAAEITARAGALSLSLATLTDARMEAMRRSARAAGEGNIPVALDLVGVGCSSLRLEFARELLRLCRPAVLKGNRAELAALEENRTLARGVDARDADLLADWRGVARRAMEAAAREGCVVLVSGPVDVIALPERAAACQNGHPMLGELTGTGCMLNVLTACFAAVGEPFEAAVLAAALEGVAGEIAAAAAGGPGSFHAGLFDAVSRLTDRELETKMKVEWMES